MAKSKKKKYTLLTPEAIDEMPDMEALVYVLDKMKERILAAGVHPKTYLYTELEAVKLKDEKLKEAREFFTELYAKEFEAARVAYNFIPAHAWNNYKDLYNEENFPEHEHLRHCYKALRDQWQKRPIKRIRGERKSGKKKQK